MIKSLACVAAVACAIPVAAMAEQPKTANGMLVDEDGMTLYTFDADAKAADGGSACKDQCATIWPAAKADDYDKASGNWTLVKTADLNAVANDGLSAGLQNNYIKSGDARVIAHTKVVGGGQSDTVTFPTSKLKAGESYSYLCTFPGHSALMKGTLKFG